MRTISKVLAYVILFTSVGILTYYVTNNLINNTLLAIAALLLVVGLFVYILTNKVYDDI